MIAWALMQVPMWTIDYAYLPTIDASIHGHILSWADTRALAMLGTPSGHTIWFVNVRDSQRTRMQALEAAGFADQANVANDPWRKVFLKRTPHAPIPSGAPPTGITIRPLAGLNEVDAYVDLHRAAFGSTNMTHEWRSRVLRRPEYRADLDLVAVTEEGQLVGFCVGWFDAAGTNGQPCGQIEPMGVHPAFQRRGLGRALLVEALQRFYRAGAAAVDVEADETNGGAMACYQSVGFQIADRVLVCRKDYSNAMEAT